jgi:hypothetical protein
MKKSAFFGIIVCTLALVSCGGSTSVPSTIVIPGSLQNYMTTPTYQAGTEELAAFYAINTFRNSVGLGYWNQSIYLDNAAYYHMQYSINNPNASDPSLPFQTDIEVAGNPNFYGTTPSNRAITAGYYFVENTPLALNVSTAYVGELYSTGSGADIVNTMVNTIYHRSGLMAQATVALGFARDTSGTITASTPTHWWVSHGRLTTSQSVASNYVGVYPYDQEINVPLHMDAENPSVYSTVAGAFDFTNNTSSPVSITTSTLVQLSEISFTVMPVGSSTPLAGNVWKMSNDPNLNTSDYSQATINLTTPPAPVPTLAANEVYWVGTKPFLPNTTYIATFVGSTYLIPYAVTNSITKSWTFTTGSGT